MAEPVEVARTLGEDDARTWRANKVVITEGGGRMSQSEPERASPESIHESDGDMLFSLRCHSGSKHEHHTGSTIDAQWLEAIIQRVRS